MPFPAKKLVACAVASAATCNMIEARLTLKAVAAEEAHGVICKKYVDDAKCIERALLYNIGPGPWVKRTGGIPPGIMDKINLVVARQEPDVEAFARLSHEFCCMPKANAADGVPGFPGGRMLPGFPGGVPPGFPGGVPPGFPGGVQPGFLGGVQPGFLGGVHPGFPGGVHPGFPGGDGKGDNNGDDIKGDNGNYPVPDFLLTNPPSAGGGSSGAPGTPGGDGKGDNNGDIIKSDDIKGDDIKGENKGAGKDDSKTSSC